MNYASIQFLLFVLATFVVYYLVPSKVRWSILLISSVIFYYLFSKMLIIYLILVTLFVYIISRIITKYEKQKKKILTISILIIVLGLLIFKYNIFLASIINPLIKIFKIEIKTHRFILPIGISYFTLDMISYIRDVYYKKIEPEKNYFKLLLFFSFFPKIVEGPFCKYKDMSEQFNAQNKFDYERNRKALLLIGLGFFKKLVIADRCALMVDTIFDSNLKGLIVLIAILLYTIQIYCDFSGCIDIIGGVAELFNIKLPKNFNQPFFSKSIQEFWQRWHITLGTWLKENIFYPVSLSKINIKLNSKVRKWKNKHLSKFIIIAFPLLFVWLVNGLWHGASWKYIFYGMYYYVIMMIGVFAKPLFDKIIKLLKIDVKSKLFQLFQMIRTFIIVNFGMLFFRASSIKKAFEMISRIGLNISAKIIHKSGLTKENYIVLFITILLLLIYEILEEKGINIREKIEEKSLLIRWPIYLFIIFSILIFGIYGPGFDSKNFIYGGF